MDLLDQIVRIPHLRLPLSFDLERLQAEARGITEFVAYKALDPRNRAAYETAWAGRSLFNDSGDSRHGMEEFSAAVAPERRDTIRSTDLAEQCPYMVEVATALNARRRARVMLVRAGKALNWHCHVYGAQGAHVLTIQVPVIVPPGFVYSVTPRANIVWPEPGVSVLLDPQCVFEREYAAGVPMVFNSYHFHNVFNRSDQDRVTLMMYMDARDPANLGLLEAAVAAYNGPYIDE